MPSIRNFHFSGMWPKQMVQQVEVFAASTGEAEFRSPNIHINAGWAWQSTNKPNTEAGQKCWDQS